MRKLADMFNTKYFYSAWSSEIQSIREDIDIAGCKVTEDISKHIMNLMRRGFLIIDSEDLNRNKILDMNRRIIDNENFEKTIKVTGFPGLSYSMPVTEYINRLDSSKYYHITKACEHPMSEICQIAIVVLVSMVRKDINIVIGNKICELFSFVDRFFTREDAIKLINAGETFVYLHVNSPYTVKVKSMLERIETVTSDSMTFEELFIRYKVIPNSILGDESDYQANFYAKLYKECMSIIKEEQRKRITLAEFVKEIK